MRLFVLYLLSLATAVLAQHQWHKRKTDIAPGRYIVEFDHRIEISSYQIGEDNDPRLLTQSIFYRDVQALGMDVTPLRNFTSNLFQGASFDVANYDIHTIEDLKSRDNVKNVWPARYLKLFDYEASPAAFSIWNPHSFTGVQALHDRGLTGKGITVAVVDTGIDYSHPALGGGIGPGFKVAGGYNFVGDGYAIDELHPNRNPKDCWGHGTHVAGIVAGQSQNLVGVAPNATLLAYKVFSCGGNPTDDILVAAFEKAYFDGADIITCSIGSAGTGFMTDPTAMLASRIAELGIFISIAAGNEGDTGPYYPSSPASGELVTSVASVEASTVVTWTARANSTFNNSTTNSNTTDLQYVTTTGYAPDLSGTFDLLVFDSCDRLATLAPSANNNTAILFPAAGKCLGYSFYNQAKSLGYPLVLNYLTTANGKLWYNQPSLGAGFQISVFGTTTFEFGQWALRQPASSNLSITLDGKTSSVSSAYKNAGFVNTFSTWGPTYDGRFYPDIAAPGGNIFSTWLDSRYSIISGTSMATPYIAGVAALHFESLGGRPSSLRAGTNLRKQLITTADFIGLYTQGPRDSPTDYAPVIQQGGGLVNAVRLVDTKTIVDSDPAVSLTDSTTIEKPVQFRVKNTHDTVQTYSFQHDPSVTINTKSKNGMNMAFFPPYTHESLKFKSLSGDSITIPPQSVGEVVVQFTLPANVDFSVSPVFQGKIKIKSATESIGIVYVGKFLSFLFFSLSFAHSLLTFLFISYGSSKVKSMAIHS